MIEAMHGKPDLPSYNALGDMALIASRAGHLIADTDLEAMQNAVLYHPQRATCGSS